jgi:hypothetical protein
MSKKLGHGVIVALAIVASAAAHTATPVDDAGTVVTPPLASLQWAPPVPGRRQASLTHAEFDVALRLHVAAFKGRPVRIWMTMRTAGPVPSNMVARWPGRGFILGGTLREGARTLVFEGVPTRPYIEESLPFRVEADASRTDRIQQLRFEFEAESR